MAVDTVAVERIVRELLVAIGEDPNRDGLRDTPARVARFWSEFADFDGGNHLTSFEHVRSDDLVAVGGMRVWSLCEHHLLPFSAELTVGYLPTGRVLGLSKFGRMAHVVAHRLQVQERLVAELANLVQQTCQTEDVAVVARGEHTCMSMRGIRTPATLHTSVMRGRFRDDSSLRAEFLALVR